MKKSFVSICCMATILAINPFFAYAADEFIPAKPYEPNVSFGESMYDTINHLTISDSAKDYLVSVYNNGINVPAVISNLPSCADDTQINCAEYQIWEDLSHVMGNYYIANLPSCIDIYAPDNDVPYATYSFHYDFEYDENGLLNHIARNRSINIIGTKPDTLDPMSVQMSFPDSSWMDRYTIAVQSIKDLVRGEMGITDGDTKETALVKFNDWFCDHWTYDESYAMADLLTCITERRGVCSQIAQIFEIAADYCGVDCELMDMELHVCLQANFNGSIYYYDPTWCLGFYQQTGKRYYRNKWVHITYDQLREDHAPYMY